MNRTADGSAVGQWTDSPSFNQQWTLVAIDSYYKLINRANGKAVDTGGQMGDGAVMQFWYDNISFNQQWAFEFVNSSTSASAATSAVQLSAPAQQMSVTLAKPTNGVARVSVSDKFGLIWAEGTFEGALYDISTANIPAGRYMLRVADDYGVVEEWQVLIKP